MHPQAINKHLIAVHAIVPCTMRVQGRLGKVLALTDDLGRFYGRGKTGPNTDSLKVRTRQTDCLDLTSGPQPLQGTGKHVVKSDLAQPVPYTQGTS